MQVDAARRRPSCPSGIPAAAREAMANATGIVIGAGGFDEVRCEARPGG